MSDPLEPFRNLAQRLNEIAEANHATIAPGSVTIIPGDNPDEPSIITAVFILTPESVETLEETETRKTNDQFNDIFGANFTSDEQTEFLTDDEKEKKDGGDTKMKGLADDLLRDLLGENEE